MTLKSGGWPDASTVRHGSLTAMSRNPLDRTADGVCPDPGGCHRAANPDKAKIRRDYCGGRE